VRLTEHGLEVQWRRGVPVNHKCCRRAVSTVGKILMLKVTWQAIPLQIGGPFLHPFLSAGKLVESTHRSQNRRPIPMHPIEKYPPTRTTLFGVPNISIRETCPIYFLILHHVQRRAKSIQFIFPSPETPRGILLILKVLP
jgi:hypothetical protein